MPPRFCCCEGCLIVDDSFNRNGSDLGPSWTHETGDWITVATGPWKDGYAEVQTAGAIAIHDMPHPLPDESAVVFGDIIDEVADSGDVYRLIINAVDKDSYHYAEFVRNGASNSVMRLGVSSSGTDTVLISRTITSLSDPVMEPRRMSVMIADNEFCAAVSHSIYSKVYIEEAVIPLGYKAGMGGSEGARFSFWEFNQHAQTNEDCQHCLCNCELNYLPPILNAHLAGTGRMASLSCDIELRWVEIDGNYQGSATCCNQLWELQLDCPGAGAVPPYDANSAKLTVIIGCIDSDGIDTGDYYISNGVRLANELSSCEPISLVFGVFNVSNLDLSCGCPTAGMHASSGTYTITVTE